MFDHQITLNQRIAVIDRSIIQYIARLQFAKDSEYDEFREMLSFYSSRRRWLLKRLLKVQLKQFIR